MREGLLLRRLGIVSYIFGTSLFLPAERRWLYCSMQSSSCPLTTGVTATDCLSPELSDRRVASVTIDSPRVQTDGYWRLSVVIVGYWSAILGRADRRPAPAVPHFFRG